MIRTKVFVFIVIHLAFIVSLWIAYPIIRDSEQKEMAYIQTIKHSAERVLVLSNFKNPAHAEAFISICEKKNFDWTLALAVSSIESQHDQYAFSSALARGYFQIMKDTFRFICESTPGMVYQNKYDIYDGANNIWVGVTHLKYCVETYGTSIGLHIYNNGEYNYFTKGYRSPQYVGGILKKQLEIQRKYAALKKDFFSR